MPKLTKENTENREALVINAMLICPNVDTVANQTGISKTQIYKMLHNDSFQEKLQEARARATEETIIYLQGSLNLCAEALIDIVKDRELPPQVRINAINSVFTNLKALDNSNSNILLGAVKIIDSI